jgi:hypothetical protein
MSLRLRRQVRVMAGWLVAMAYLLCVAAPAMALGHGGYAPCFADEMPVAIVAPAQDDAAAMTAMHGGGSIHDHDHHAHHHMADGAAGHDGTAHHHTSGNLPGPCCAMLCISALPAELPALAAPSQPASVCVLEAERSAPDNTPPLLYRPPIA